MKEIFVYLKNYIEEGNKNALLFTTLVVALLIGINYSIGIESAIRTYKSPGIRLLAFFLLYAFTFNIVYGIHFLVSGNTVNNKKQFYFLLLLCPLIFAAKISMNVADLFGNAGTNDQWQRFWTIIINWPLKCLLILTCIYTIWTVSRYEKPVAGMTRTFNWKPYIFLLLCSLPLLAIAGSMDQFQKTYPKVKNIAFIEPYTGYDFVCKIFYELSYGTDFLTIEAFFRGFVLLAFVRYVGRGAILPMAAFYCTIHFGKPLFECITSYIGGIILGAIVYETRSIWGGLIVHLGMAWLMEATALIL